MKGRRSAHRDKKSYERFAKERGINGAEEIPEPCTSLAYEMGCTCHIPVAGPTAIDPPDPRVDWACPIHGDAPDPDYLRDKVRDDELTGDY